MNGLSLQDNWKFKDVKENIEALVNQFEGLLSPFLYFQGKERRALLHNMKVQVFGFDNILYWQREKLWEVLNGDFDIDDFKRLQ
jgi:hypothetical protein